MEVHDSVMSWVSLTREHVMDRMAEHELDAIEQTGGGPGDRLTGILAQVTALVRGKVAACRSNTLGDAGKIPEECVFAAATLCRHALRSALPVMAGDAELETRRAEYAGAMAFLDQVAACEVAITDDEGPVSGADSGSFGGDAKHSF